MIRKMDSKDEVSPKGYSKILGFMIIGFISIFLVSLILYT